MIAGSRIDAYFDHVGAVHETARHRYLVEAKLPGLSIFERVVLAAPGEGAHVVILCCEDDLGNRFSYLGPASSADRVAPGERFIARDHASLYPVYRSTWPRWPEDRAN